MSEVIYSSTQSSRFKRAQYGVKENRPPIEVNQRWICCNKEGEVFRRIRILAKHPDGGWIYKDEAAKMGRIDLFRISTCPEFYLRFVFELEQ